ncbi:MAG: basic amino acid ABC transporter substrate-binding protein [Neisseria sp.]|nr:basic amino acid ABC transporter substrate-binding protein [Neisseria sp.]
MNMKKWLSAALACSVLTLGACGGQKAQENAASAPAAESKVYRVGMNAEFAPFEFLDKDNNVQGFDVDLLNAMAEAGGFKVEYKHQPWDSLFAALGNGDVDVLASAVTITKEREETMAFTKPYFEVTQVILVPKGKNIHSVEDLKNVNKVGVVTGNTGDLTATKILGANSQKIARFENLTLVTKELENGGLDAVVSDSAVVGNYIRNNSDKGFTMVKVPDFDVENYGMAVRKNDTETLKMLEDAFDKVKANGEYDKVFQKYFAE